MANIDLKFYSHYLGMESSAQVILPDERPQKMQDHGEKKYPVLYLLHGQFDDDTAYIRKSLIETYVQNMDLIVVMPNVHRSFYTNCKEGHAYYSFIEEELPVIIGNFFHASPNREDRFIAGLSMGGYGALKIALNAPHKYAACASMSGAIDPIEANTNKEAKAYPVPDMAANIFRVFGSKEDFKNSENDLCFKLRELDKTEGPKPKFFISCGSDDFLLHQNKEFVRIFKEELETMDCVFKQTPGSHNWEYWNKALIDVLDFFGFTKK